MIAILNSDILLLQSFWPIHSRFISIYFLSSTELVYIGRLICSRVVPQQFRSVIRLTSRLGHEDQSKFGSAITAHQFMPSLESVSYAPFLLSIQVFMSINGLEPMPVSDLLFFTNYLFPYIVQMIVEVYSFSILLFIILLC